MCKRREKAENFLRERSALVVAFNNLNLVDKKQLLIMYMEKVRIRPLQADNEEKSEIENECGSTEPGTSDLSSKDSADKTTS